MTSDSALDRQEQWALVVRRSFGIRDGVDNDGAMRTLTVWIQDHLEQKGWQGPTRTIAEPMVDALMALGASGGLDDHLLPAALHLSAASFDARNAAYRLIETGTTLVDPQDLVFDVKGEYPPEILAAAEDVMGRVHEYVCETEGP